MLPHDIPDDAHLLELIEARHPASVSLVVGSSPRPSDHERVRIAVRDAIDRAAKRLDELDLPHGVKNATIERLRRPLQDDDFWEHQSQAMLILATSEMDEWYRLPFEVEDEVTVADRFDVRMLMRARSDIWHAFVLLLSRGRVRLVEVTSAGLAEHPLEMPDDHQLMLQRANNEGRMDRGPAQGADGDRPERERFCKVVAEAVGAIVPRAVPLVLCATDDLRQAYRAQNRHPLLLDDEIAGHPEALADRELEERVMEVLRARNAQHVKDWKERFGNLRQQGLATSKVAHVAAAAAAAAIEELRVDRKASRSGDIDEWGRLLNRDGDRRFLLLDLAADVMRTGGEVIAVPREDLTDGSPVAAILRFEVQTPNGG